MHEDLLNKQFQIELAKHVARAITSIANMPTFGVGGVPVEVAVKVYGKSALW